MTDKKHLQLTKQLNYINQVKKQNEKSYTLVSQQIVQMRKNNKVIGRNNEKEIKSKRRLNKLKNSESQFFKEN